MNDLARIVVNATDRFHIVATERKSGKRLAITMPMSGAMAKEWQPTVTDKLFYKYFKVAKVKAP